MIPGEREKAVLEAMEALPKEHAVLIGGYAVNAYVPPRFSIDCDLVVLGNLEAMESKLKSLGYAKEAKGKVPYGSCVRYVKGKGKNKVSFDLLVDAVEDRQTGVVFKKPLFERYSAVRTTAGRLSTTRIRLRIVNPELLFVMKFVAGRTTDVRDIFMLASENLDWDVVKDLVKAHCTKDLIEKKAAEVRETVSDKKYRDALQGPFGVIPDKKFESCSSRLLGFLGEMVRP